MNFPMKLFMAIDIRHIRAWMLAVLVLCVASLLRAQSDADAFPPKPEPAVYVHDYAGWLGGGEKATLEEKLRRYHDSTSTQIVVMIRSDLGGYDKASYAFELGNRWGIGRKDKNNGVVMLIKSEPPDRGIFIATGYGTEGALPDITAGNIIRNTMAPYFRQQQYYQGIDAGVDDIIKALGGEFVADASEPLDGSALLILLIVFGILIAVIVFVFYRVKKGIGTSYTADGKGRSRRSHDPFGGGWWIGGGGFGGGSSGGSDWGGGGGSDGGSFGGGSFGGGGAGGDW
jgi:uncharacterized protein